MIKRLLFIIMWLVALPFLTLHAQSPGSVDGTEAWFMTVNTLVGSSTCYKWDDYSGEYLSSNRIDNFNNMLNDFPYPQKESQIKILNYNPALNFQCLCLQSTLSHTNMTQGTVIGVFDLSNWSENRRLLHVGDNTPYYWSVNPNQYKNQEHELSLPNSALTNGLPHILSYYHAFTPSHSSWGEDVGKTLTISTDNAPQYSRYCPELLVYSRILNPLERRQVESYLALKYGVSLNGSYFDHDGNLLWDYDANNGFNNHITGIASDTCNLFLQPRSTSSYESPSLLTIGITDATSMQDGDYLIWGDNGLTLISQPYSENSPWHLMPREWKASTDGISTTTVDLSCSSGAATDFHSHRNNGVFLLIEPDSEEPVNPATALQVKCSSSTNYTLTFDSVHWDTDNSHGDRFTFAYYDGIFSSVTPFRSSCVAGGDDGRDGHIDITVTHGSPYYAYVLKADTVYAYPHGYEVGKSSHISTTQFSITGLYCGKYILTLYRCGPENKDTTQVDDNNTQTYTVHVGTECNPDIPNKAVLQNGTTQQPSLAPRHNGITGGIGNLSAGTSSLAATPDGERRFAVTLSASGASGAMLLVYDTTGRLLLRQSFSSDNEAATAIFDAPYPGVYLLKALTATEEHTLKLSVK